MIVITLAVLVFFVWIYTVASNETPSVDSGTNLAVTTVMVLVMTILASFTSLKVSIDDSYLRIKFGYGIFFKKFALNEIASVRSVKNHWYYGWGIRVWFWPPMWIYNISGFDAVEIVMKSGRIYRIGTDEPEKLEQAITQGIK